MRAAWLLLVLAACEPAWGVNARVKYPGVVAVPVEDATVAVACTEASHGGSSMAVRTSPDGKAYVGGIGHQFPVGCDVFVAKPGYQTQRIRYRDLCPNGPDGCERVFAFDLVLSPMPQ